MNVRDYLNPFRGKKKADRSAVAPEKVTVPPGYYEPDDGELTQEQLDAIKAAEPQGRMKRVIDSLF